MKASKESAPIGVMRPQQQHRRRSMKTTQSARRLRVSEVKAEASTASRNVDEHSVKNDSAVSSETSFEKTFFFGRRLLNKSENTFTQHEIEDLPDIYETYGLEQNMTRARNIPSFLAGGAHGYQNEVYVAASAIFERLASRKEVGKALVQYPPLGESVPVPSFSTPQIKRQAYELAYETLKYQELLEEIIAESGYLFAHPAGEDTSALIMVMLFDFQHRRWGPRSHIIGDKAQREVEEIDSNLMDHRIHLAASLARSRIKNQSLSIDYVLPENVRNQEKNAADLPQYAWINTMKMTIKEVLQHLDFLEFAEFLDTEVLIPPHGKYYRRDRHCDDVIIFPADQKEPLKAMDLVERGMLVLQDKTSSLAVQSVAALLTGDDDGDLVHADVASGLTTAHLAVVLYRKAKERKDTQDFMFRKTSASTGETEQPFAVPKVFAFGVKSEEHRQELTAYFDKLKIKNIELLSERFEKTDPKKEDVMKFAKVKIALLSPQCTRTAVSNPIEFMLNEGDNENYRILKELSHGDMHKKATDAGHGHVEMLKAALKFMDIKSVVYITRSIHPQENELAINTAVKWFRENSGSSQPFRVCPPTLPLLSSDIQKKDAKKQLMSTQSLKHNFLRMRQNPQMNGCFIAVLVRELDPNDQAAVKEMLRKAALQGLVVPDKKKSSTSALSEEVQDKTPPIKSFNVHKKPHKQMSSHKKEHLPTRQYQISSAPKSTASFSSHRTVTPSRSKHSGKEVQSTNVDQLLSNYQKAQAAKQDATEKQKPPNLVLHEQPARKLQAEEKGVASSLQSKEYEFGQQLPHKKK